MPYKIKPSFLFIPIVLTIFIFAIFAGAQDSGSVGSSAVDKEAVEKLGKMTPDEVKALDKKLADALTLYYDREFARALPIFQEIASKAETMDIMFWIGTSAMQTGEKELAVAKF